MKRLTSCLQKCHSQNQKVFVGYITAGDPDLQSTRMLCKILADNGVDIIELGVPFSDPLADGPTNQRAASRALASGTSLSGILEMVSTLRTEGFTTPLVIFSYLNPIYRMGFETFATKAAAAGVDGVLCVDLPAEEAVPFLDAMKNHKLETIFLASPTSDSKRLKSIDDASSAFVYYVSRTGVTGAQNDISESLEIELSQVKKIIKKPVMIGFGISSPEQAKRIAEWGDGIVIGSAIVQFVEKFPKDPNALEELQELIRNVRSSLDSL